MATRPPPPADLDLRDLDLDKEPKPRPKPKHDGLHMALAGALSAGGGRDEQMENLLREVDAEFMLTIKDAEEKENKK